MKRLELAPLGFLILLIGGTLYLSFLGAFDLLFFEIQPAEVSREMFVTNDLTTPRLGFEPLWAEPPLFNWMQTLSYKHFGINEFSVRLPSAIGGILILLICFNIGSSLFSKTFGWLWALFMSATALSFLFFKTGNSHTIMALLVFLSTYFAVKLFFDFEFQAKKISRRNRFLSLTLSGFCGGLAVLSAGPETLLLIALPVLFLVFFSKGASGISFNKLFLWLFLVMAISASWYGYMMYEKGAVSIQHWLTYYIKEFSMNLESLKTIHLQIFALFVLGFPSIIFIWDALKRNKFETKEQIIMINFMYAFLATSIFLVIMSGGRKPEYLSLSIFSISFLASIFFHDLLKGKREWKKYHSVQMGIILSSFIVCFLIVELNDYVNDIRHLYWHLLLGTLLAAIIFSIIFIVRKKWLPLLYSMVISGVILSFASWILLFHVEGMSEKEVKKFVENNRSDTLVIHSCSEEEIAHLFYLGIDSMAMVDMQSKFQDTSYLADRFIYSRDLTQCSLAGKDYLKLFSKDGYHFLRIVDSDL